MSTKDRERARSSFDVQGEAMIIPCPLRASSLHLKRRETEGGWKTMRGGNERTYIQIVKS